MEDGCEEDGDFTRIGFNRCITPDWLDIQRPSRMPINIVATITIGQNAKNIRNSLSNGSITAVSRKSSITTVRQKPTRYSL